MSLNRIKVIAMLLVMVPMLMVVVFKSSPVGATAVAADDDSTATFYKGKCSMCHTPTASKFFDPARPEDEMVAAILNGKKGEKPPYMPAFADKGVTADQAKALIGYMKSLKSGS